jgi:endonuclease YncB( thermonuclease family)
MLAIAVGLKIDDEAGARIDAPQHTPRHTSEITGSAYVVDGDTIRIHGERIRLHGIDAPESDQTCRDSGGLYQCGQRARQALVKKIGNGIVRCEARGRDRYNRIIAVCRSDGENLNAWMVGEGWALAYRQYSSDFILREIAASTLNRGIWNGDFVSPWDWRQGRRR